MLAKRLSPKFVQVCRALGGHCRFKHPLKRLTTFKIGGPADVYVEPRTEEALQTILIAAHASRVPVHILGAGSNLLVCDGGVRGVVIRLRHPAFCQWTANGRTVEAGAGLLLASVVRRAREEGLGGLEFLTGIPGTLGGAVVMNAGAWGSEIASCIRQVRVMMTRGRVRVIGPDALGFSYRSSRIKRLCVLSVTLQLTMRPVRAIDQRIARYRRQRQARQPVEGATAGSIFRNPPQQAAGRLIDLCGLRGKTVGGAKVSLQHANWIVNDRTAQAADVLRLMRVMRREVLCRYGVKLDPEIRVWK